MSVSNYKTILEAILSSNGYREIPENKTVTTTAISHNHKSYSLKWSGTGTNIEYYTSGKLAYENAFELVVKYKNMNSGERDSNAQVFLDLLNSLSYASGFLGFIDGAKFEDIDTKHTQGTIKVLIGAESNC